MSCNNKNEEYTIMELLQELIADNSWEKDQQNRTQIVFGLLYTLIS
ncbi:hypothetical protein [Alkalibacter mobilis]|nr:hypothetical protein [Alkalibacter mobilis]MBF7097668.1 hypothetical protein [Alkalibacter mobilis]